MANSKGFRKIIIKVPEELRDKFNKSVKKAEGSTYFRTKVLKTYIRKYCDDNPA
jgi:hypothetical protein